MPAFPDLARTSEESADLLVGDLLTGPFQVELRGVLMDSLACSGLVIGDKQFLDGFGVPDTRNQDVERAMRHGLHASPQYLGGRHMTVGVAAIASTLALLKTYKKSLGAAWAPIDADTDADFRLPMAFTLASLTDAYLVFGKPLRAPWNYQTLLKTYATQEPFVDAALCEFLATDPRIYSLILQSTAATLGTASGGHGWSRGWPHGWGTATPGSASCINAGNFQTYPRITIAAGTGMLSNPTVSNVTTGKSWQIALTLAAGDFLVVDFQEQTAKLNGTADRQSFVTRPPSTWWTLPPGTNTVQFTGTGTDATATIEWRDASLL